MCADRRDGVDLAILVAVRRDFLSIDAHDGPLTAGQLGRVPNREAAKAVGDEALGHVGILFDQLLGRGPEVEPSRVEHVCPGVSPVRE